MKSRMLAPIIAHLLGRDNLALIDILVSTKNIRECEINQNFRLYDLMTMLSFKYTTDAVLTCYMHYLSSVYPNVYFVNPTLYKWVEDYKRTTIHLDNVWLEREYLVWPLNLENNHWVVAVMRTKHGSTIFIVTP